MSYMIAIPKEFTQSDGRPFRQQILGKDNRGVPDEDQSGVPEGQTRWASEDASWVSMIKLFLNNIFDVVAAEHKIDPKKAEELKHEDSATALDIFRVLNLESTAKDGTVELEKHPYEWLNTMLKSWGVRVFGVNAAVIHEPIKKAVEEDPTRAEKHRELKAG